jgi:hypothetical protein
MAFSISGLDAKSWRIVGSLPPGLQAKGTNGETLSGDTLNAASGIISGAPTTSGAYAFTVQAYDAINLGGTTDGQQL